MTNSINEMKNIISDKFRQYAKKIEGTDCTDWTGTINGSGAAQIWFAGDIMARTVAQSVWILYFDEDLNNTSFFLKNTCGNNGCTNPEHYEKRNRSNLSAFSGEVKKKEKPIIKKPEKDNILVIPRWQLRQEKFDEIKRSGCERNIKFYSNKFNIPLATVKKIIAGKAVLST